MSRKERNSGAAMVIVLCVMVVFLALSTTIILAGSVTLNTARNNVIYERGKVQASSLSELFVRDLIKRDIADDSSTLLRYVRNQIMNKNWPAYDERTDNPDAIKTFTMDADEDSKHQISIEMYWTWEGTDENLALEKESEMSEHSVYLYVDVISTLNASEYHVKREFKLESTKSETAGGSHDVYPQKWLWTAVGRSEDRDK